MLGIASAENSDMAGPVSEDGRDSIPGPRNVLSMTEIVQRPSVTDERNCTEYG